MQVFLIRHPRPLIKAGRCYGQLDVDCEDPQPIAERLRSRIPAGTPVVASPLRRARRLAEAIEAAASVDPRLMEINFGMWEGRSWNDIDRRALDAWAADVLNFTPPGGESVADLQRRAIAFARECEAAGMARLAIVAHAGMLRALAGHWRRLPFAEWSGLEFDFGSLSEISTDQGSALP